MEPTPDDAQPDELAPVQIAAYATGEHLTVLAPRSWHARLAALEKVTSYGPSYQRRVVDTLTDLSHKTRSGYLELAARDLEYCERIAGIV